MRAVMAIPITVGEFIIITLVIITLIMVVKK
jgi:hypothetical protein